MMAAQVAAAEPVRAPHPLEVAVDSVGRKYVADSSAVLVIGISSPEGRRIWGFGTFEGHPPDGETLFEIGSVTKTMTGVLLARLHLEQTVHLDDPVRQFFPDDWTFPRRNRREISLLHLTTHTSSLPRMPPDFLGFTVVQAALGNEPAHDPYAHYCLEDLKTSLANVKLTRPIGSEMVYSNFGVGLLGQALARSAGYEDPAELFKEKLLQPLGMSDTVFKIPAKQQARLAPPLNADGSPAHTWHFAALKACGGLRSCANDMLRYGDAATARVKTPLEPAFQLSLQRWRKIDEGLFMGLGWFIRSVELPHRGDETTTLVWHSGGTGGYRAFLAIFPEYDITLVLLTNTPKRLDPTVSGPILNALFAKIASGIGN